MKKSIEAIVAAMQSFIRKVFKQAGEQAVLVYLDGVSLPEEVYESCDLFTLEDQLEDALRENGAGDFDGDEIGEEGTILFIYGPSAKKILAAIEPVLRSYPLCQNARAVLRYGEPGSPQDEVSLS